MLRHRIIQEIENQDLGRIPFSRYMELMLYHPEWGYYNQEKEKVGKAGDFYTSSSVGAVFGQVWADAFIRAWKELNLIPDSEHPLILLEVGGGTANFARAVLDECLHKYGELYPRIQYWMVEQSPYHCKLQRERLEQHLDRVRWFDTLDDVSKAAQQNRTPTIIFSNELFDALPVERVKRMENGLQECWISLEHGQLLEVWIPLEREDLALYLEEMEISLPMHHQIEVPIAAHQFFKTFDHVQEYGYLFTVDYGWRKKELLVPQRSQGTLIGYYQHQHITDFYQYFGEMDITSHVHFDALMKWGEDLGYQNLSFKTQREWLIAQGIMEKLVAHQDPNPFSQMAKWNRAIVQLISPGGMGDTFKVLTQKKEGKK